MIILVDTEEEFDKTQIPFMIKVLSKYHIVEITQYYVLLRFFLT